MGSAPIHAVLGSRWPWNRSPRMRRVTERPDPLNCWTWLVALCETQQRHRSRLCCLAHRPVLTCRDTAKRLPCLPATCSGREPWLQDKLQQGKLPPKGSNMQRWDLHLMCPNTGLPFLKQFYLFERHRDRESWFISQITVTTSVGVEDL